MGLAALSTLVNLVDKKAPAKSQRNMLYIVLIQYCINTIYNNLPLLKKNTVKGYKGHGL
jgi:hypothetical protein